MPTPSAVDLPVGVAVRVRSTATIGGYTISSFGRAEQNAFRRGIAAFLGSGVGMSDVRVVSVSAVPRHRRALTGGSHVEVAFDVVQRSEAGGASVHVVLSSVRADADSASRLLDSVRTALQAEPGSTAPVAGWAVLTLQLELVQVPQRVQEAVPAPAQGMSGRLQWYYAVGIMLASALVGGALYYRLEGSCSGHGAHMNRVQPSRAVATKFDGVKPQRSGSGAATAKNPANLRPARSHNTIRLPPLALAQGSRPTAIDGSVAIARVRQPLSPLSYAPSESSS